MRDGPTAQPVTANDFVYAWRREVDPATGSEYAQALAPIENALDIASGKMPVDKLGVEVSRPQTLIVHLHAPTPYLLALLTNTYLYPLYEPAVKQWGDAWTQPGHMVSNGPFLLSERVINGHITLLKNPYYWDASHVRLTKVNYIILADDSAADESISGGRPRLHRSHSVLPRKNGCNSYAGRSSRACSLFCDGHVRLQSGQAALRGQSEAAAGARAWPWTATF